MDVCHMISDKNNFIIMEECDGGKVRFGNGSPCVIRGKGSIALTNKINCEDVYQADGLNYNLFFIMGKQVLKGPLHPNTKIRKNRNNYIKNLRA